jgi:CRISPR-associated protein Cmr1
MQTNGGELMRDLPKDKDGKLIPVPEINVNERSGYVTQVREYELITPLFGGGVEPGTADPVTTIRATEIRGHLRFWWRATRGGQFSDDLKKMKEAEDELWGAASSGDAAFPSKVRIQIETTHRGNKFVAKNRRGEIVEVHALDSPYSYAAFPLRDRKQHVIEGVKFTLSIQYPSAAGTDVEAALWAWETFGGIGGRTRRGFGAVKLLKVNGKVERLLPSNPQDAMKAIILKLEDFIQDSDFPISLPSLSLEQDDYLLTESIANSVECLTRLLEALKSFRHDRPMNEFIDPKDGRKKKRPGRNRWPEPDEIRRLTRTSFSRHREPLSRLRAFPRAQFGLPIIFQFKDSDKGDPQITTLQGAKKESARFASPLVIKPLPCEGGKYFGLAFIFSGISVTEVPGGVILKDAPGNPKVETEITKEQAGQIDRLNGNRDVLISFLNFLDNQ